jgi:rare lipoprotein A
MNKRIGALAGLASALALAACSSSPPRGVPETRAPQSASQSAPPSRAPARGGGYYKDDGPLESTPDLDRIPDAVPRAERLHRFANNPYQVFGKDYVPVRVGSDFRQRGMASWYGRRYHGQKTSSGEMYDMFGMTAAHPTLPIPSYARVTNVATGRSVVVRVNDRGPFLADRVIDLSYVAAHKLGYIQAGSTLVDVEVVTADSPQVTASAAQVPPPQPLARPAPPPPVAEVVAPPQREAPPLPVSSDPSGVYLQLGAFSMRDNAESFRARVYKDLAWLNEAMHVNAQGGLFRLQLGPYRSQEEARQMAERIRAELNLQPVLLVR